MDDVVGVFDAMAATYDELEPWYEHLYARVHAIVREARRARSTPAVAQDFRPRCSTPSAIALTASISRLACWPWRTPGCRGRHSSAGGSRPYRTGTAASMP